MKNKFYALKLKIAQILILGNTHLKKESAPGKRQGRKNKNHIIFSASYSGSSIPADIVG